jgi:hypothetical protein
MSAASSIAPCSVIAENASSEITRNIESGNRDREEQL